MKDDLDIGGKEYAFVTRPNFSLDRAPKSAGSQARLEGYHLLGEMDNTPYGHLLIYYTGNEPRYLALQPKRYQFYGDSRGHTIE
jgi:hypothetical protein